MSEFKDMSAEAQNELIKKLSNLLQEHQIDATVKTINEVVCAVGGKAVEHNVSLNVTKEMPSTDAEKAKKFNEAAKPLVEGIKGVQMNVVSKMGAGDMYQEITKVKKCEGEGDSITHKEGDVLLIDFWATWCPPCQAPMAHNQTMLEKKAAEWGSTVRIIGLSIDQTMDKVVDHVKAKKWESVEHYHRHESDCSTVYGVRGVPHVMLVDKSGRIVFKGHPATRKDLEGDLDKLAKGEQLTGEGIVNGPVAGGAEAKKEEDPTYKKLDLEKVMGEIAEFKTVCSGFQSNEDLQNSVKGMQRAFCVIVLQTLYDINTGDATSKYENYRVLVGKQE